MHAQSNSLHTSQWAESLRRLFRMRPTRFRSTLRQARTLHSVRLTARPKCQTLPVVSSNAPRYTYSSQNMSIPHEPHSNESTAPSPDEDWKSKAPYRIHGPGDGFEAKLEGGCHCGKVRYQLSREVPLDSKLCHCVDCQVQ